MLIGVPKEVKNHEYRVGLTPGSTHELIRLGHDVILESHAGAGAGFDDKHYMAAGAKIVATAEEVFAQSEMIIKVKEPQPQECKLLRPGQIIFTDHRFCFWNFRFGYRDVLRCFFYFWFFKFPNSFSAATSSRSIFFHLV